MKFFSVFILLSTLFVTPLCSATEDYDQLGMQLAEAINSQSVDDIVPIFFAEALAYRTANTISEDSRVVADIAAGMLNLGGREVIEMIFQSIFVQSPEARFIRTIESTKPVVRLSFPYGGYEYIVLITESTETSGPVIVDMNYLSRGLLLSENIGAATQLMSAPSESLLKRLFNIQEVNRDLVAIFDEFNQLQMVQDYPGAYAVLKTLPEEIRRSRIMLNSAVQLSAFVSEEEYFSQLELLDQHYGNDETAAFMLLDYHFLTGNADRAIQSMDLLISKLGEDAALLNLKASAYYGLLGELGDAERLVRHAIEIEPTSFEPYDTLMVILVEQARYADLSALLDIMEQNLSIEFQEEFFANDTLFSGFYASPEFQAWIQ